MPSETLRRPCPICGKPASADDAPFCSKRCADVDLGRWFSGAYTVPVAESEDDGSDRLRDEAEVER